MSATATALETSAPSATTTRRTRFARLLAVVPALAVVLATLGLAAPAQAAGSYSTGLTFCTNTAYAPVTLNIHNGSRWVFYKSGRSGANGCGTFRYLDATRAYYVSVNFQTGACWNPFLQITQGNSRSTWVYPHQVSNVGYFGTTTTIPC